MSELSVLAIASGTVVAVASGLIGSFLVLRRMTLLADALSHVALPGIALGILLHFQPLIGGVAFLFVGVALIWGIEHKTKLAVESITGVLFVTALAVGALLIPESDLLEAFFGSVEHSSTPELLFQLVIAIVVIVLATRFLKPLLLTSIAPELAETEKFSRRKMEFLLLMLIALTIAIGVSFVGVLLMSALSIIPAVSARNFARTYRGFLAASVAIAVVTLVGGLLLGHFYAITPGIAAVLIAAGAFVISLFWGRRR